MRRGIGLGIVVVALAAGGAGAEGLSRSEWQAKAKALFGTLPAEAVNPANPLTDAKIALGRTLYYDARLSKNHDVSCNSCHQLDRFGVDGEPTSPGHKGQRGDRNSPTSLNAALHIAQFWDGRAADVEAQAKGPILNPVEMAMPNEAAVLAVLDSIPGYAPMFAAAFPGEKQPVTYDNLARAIGAFERRLLTPAPLDRFIAGDANGLTDAQLAGLARFVDTGCTTCHVGPAVGGGMYQKLGLVTPYETKDPGREKVTGNPADRGVFKVPSLRNISRTGPYFHDGSVKTLPEAVRVMARHQLGKQLDDAAVNDVVAFLGALEGTVDAKYVAKPALPPSGPKTPKPDPS
jgi:cytochrome c peroxidase